MNILLILAAVLLALGVLFLLYALALILAHSTGSIKRLLGIGLLLNPLLTLVVASIPSKYFDESFKETLGAVVSTAGFFLISTALMFHARAFGRTTEHSIPSSDHNTL